MDGFDLTEDRGKEGKREVSSAKQRPSYYNSRLDYFCPGKGEEGKEKNRLKGRGNHGQRDSGVS